MVSLKFNNHLISGERVQKRMFRISEIKVGGVEITMRGPEKIEATGVGAMDGSGSTRDEGIKAQILGVNAVDADSRFEEPRHLTR